MLPIEIVFLIGMAFLLFLALKVKVNAFMSLLGTAVVMGLLAGMPATDVVGAITTGFSSTVKSIGIVIIFGIMLGNYLEASSATTRMRVSTLSGKMRKPSRKWRWTRPNYRVASPRSCRYWFRWS